MFQVYNIYLIIMSRHPCLSLATAAAQYEAYSLLHVHVETELSAAASPTAPSEHYHWTARRKPRNVNKA
jgi:hypothetical protein